MLTDFFSLLGEVSEISAAVSSADSSSFSVMDPCTGRAASLRSQACTPNDGIQSVAEVTTHTNMQAARLSDRHRHAMKPMHAHMPIVASPSSCCEKSAKQSHTERAT